jgi:Tol biopolymer transport system component
MVGGEQSLQLTQNSGDCCPRWSPDGRQIAFSRMGDAGADIYIIPATGGTEHRLFSWPSDGRPISAIPWRVNARRTTATRAPSFRPTARKSCSNPITRDTTRFGPATATV